MYRRIAVESSFGAILGDSVVVLNHFFDDSNHDFILWVPAYLFLQNLSSFSNDKKR